MPSYKLTYFNGRGRAEISRVIFAVADVQYEDVLIAFEDWPKLKPTTPFSALPVLEIDGKVTICQGQTIGRYLARKYNLAGKTELDQAMADMIVDCMVDILQPIPVFFRQEQDPDRKAALKKKYMEQTMPEGLEKLEALLKKNKGGDGYFVGDCLTWADLFLISMQSSLDLIVGVPHPFSNYPKLNNLYERVTKIPKVAAYIAKRPVAEF